jgi:hypothetical protein
MSNLIGTHVIKVAVLVTTGFGPKDLSRVLDDALVDVAATVDSALEQLE